MDSPLPRRRTVLRAIAAVGLVFLILVVIRILPLFTGPALPAGATRLHITTAAPNMDMGCATAALAPVEIAVSGDDLVLVTVDSRETVPVEWPAGFAAWRDGEGRAVLADPWGSIVGRDGDVLNSLGGGGDSGRGFHICPFGIVTKPGP